MINDMSSLAVKPPFFKFGSNHHNHDIDIHTLHRLIREHGAEKESQALEQKDP